MYASISNSLINLRESALGFLCSIPLNEVLNPGQSNGDHINSQLIIQEIKSAINEFKQEAIYESGSRVDYSRLCEAECYHRYQKELIPKLRNLDLGALKTKEEALAFWINLYNALVIHAVIEFDVKESIAEGGIHNLIRFFRRAAYDISGLRFSLEDIEHGILRGNRGNPYQFSAQFARNDLRHEFVIHPVDPRIHFALNCASKSCPPIGIYTPENLDNQLDMAASNFIQSEVRLEDGRLWISQIFNWYLGDFNRKVGLINLLIKYLPDDKRRAWLIERAQKGRFKYLPYDWALNV